MWKYGFFLDVKARPTVYDNPPASISPQKAGPVLVTIAGIMKITNHPINQIEEEGELFIDFFSKDFIENTKNGCSPLEDDDAIA